MLYFDFTMSQVVFKFFNLRFSCECVKSFEEKVKVFLKKSFTFRVRKLVLRNMCSKMISALQKSRYLASKCNYMYILKYFEILIEESWDVCQKVYSWDQDLWFCVKEFWILEWLRKCKDGIFRIYESLSWNHPNGSKAVLRIPFR